MISVVVIDNGIYTDDMAVMSKVVNAYQIESNGEICLDREEMFLENTHGGLCAWIIHDICPGVIFTSIRILDHNGKCEGEKLKTALEWCTQYNCQIIHMSFSSRSYYVYLLIQPVVQTLIQQKKILVASIDNGNVVSYPAMNENVFSVFMDNKKLFSGRKMGVFYAQNVKSYLVGIQYSKQKKCNGGRIMDLSCSNSYAAAAFTGYLANCILECENIDCKMQPELLDNMKRFGEIRVGELPKLRVSDKRTVPVIGIVQDTGWMLRAGIDFYTKLGYQIAAFSEIAVENTIPLEFYLNEEIIVDELFLENMEMIYHPDLILFQVNVFTSIRSKEIEILMKGDHNKIGVCIRERDRIFMNIQEAFEWIWNVLTEG